MNAEQQQGETHLGDGGTGGTRGVVAAQQQTFTAWDQQRALTDQLMEQVCDPKGLVSRAVKYDALRHEETAVYVKYVRWCGRTGRKAPPTRFVPTCRTN